MNYSIWEKVADQPWKRIHYGQFTPLDFVSLKHDLWAQVPDFVTSVESEKTYKSYMWSDDREEPTPQSPFTRTPPADGTVVFDVLSVRAGDIRYSEHGRIPTQYLGAAIQVAYAEAVLEHAIHLMCSGDTISVKVPSVYCY